MPFVRRLLLLFWTLQNCCRAQDASSIFGLISSIASSSTSPDCPGECRHALSALFCAHMLQGVDCGGPQLRCCVSDTTSSFLTTEAVNTQPAIPPRTPVTLKPIAVSSALGQPFSIATNLTVHDEPSGGESPEEEDEEPLAEHLPESEAQRATLCPGMCVSPFIAAFCSHIVEGVECNGGNRCCTTGEVSTPVLTTTHATPLATKRVLIIRATTPLSSTNTPLTTTTSTTTTTTTTTTITTESITESSTIDEDAIPCEGSCVTGFLSLLCDDIDPHGSCPGSQRCCVVRRLTTTTQPPITFCPGYCMPTLLSGMCNKPSRLVPETVDCNGNTICCDNTGKSTENQASQSTVDLPTRPFEFPLFPLLMTAAQSVMQSSAPSSQHPASESFIGSPHAPNSPATAAMGMDRIHGDGPPCPVPCIASFLALTCFGSSVLLEAALCPKENMVCCAPKAILQQHTPEPNPIMHPVFNNNDSLPTVPITTPIQAHQPPNPSFSCGVKSTSRIETPRIMGGQDTAPGEWCWQVALINSMNQYLCGGALIGYQWVLTAAHCITNLMKTGEKIFVRVGDYDLTNSYGSIGAQTQRIAAHYVHHNHNSQTLDNNIALLKLANQVELRPGVCLVCLPVRVGDVRPGQRCTVTGYGYMGENGPIPLRVRAVDLPIVSDQECTKKVNAVTEKVFVLPASSFCAGGEEGHDACQGDGGGPMVCEVDGFYELTGIVSWGFGCGRRDVPGVYVKVSSFVGWINQIISINNS